MSTNGVEKRRNDKELEANQGEDQQVSRKLQYF